MIMLGESMAKLRVIGDRLVARVGDVHHVVGRFVRCPCCGQAVDFRRAT